MNQSRPTEPREPLPPPEFPCRQFPAEPRPARLLGLYPQRQQGLWMQRVRVPGGVLTGDQWRALAGIARRFTPATPLHLTTRQDIELHDLPPESAPALQQELALAGLTSLGSGGDTLRNITVCPRAAGGTQQAPDLLPLARTIGAVLAGYEHLFCLPRKFKLSLSGCGKACGRPFAQDLAFVVVQHGDGLGLRAIGAGSLGPKPATGIVLFQRIEPGEAPALALAAVRLFERLGDRQNRSQARLRHVRQRLGDAEFLAELGQELAAVKRERPWPAVPLSLPSPAPAASIAMNFPNGDVTAEAADALAAAAEAPGCSSRIGNDHCVWLWAAGQELLDAALQRHPGLAGLTVPQPRVIACPGTRWCARALADTNNLADRIRAALGAGAPTEMIIALSGCPNGCAHSAIADIGLIGGRRSDGGEALQAYSLLAGGGRGADATLARGLAKGLSADEALRKVSELAHQPPATNVQE